MNIVAIAGSAIPSDTANSIQVMKACNALVQLGHKLTLIVPDNPQSSTINRKSETLNLKSHYGLQTDFPIEWLTSTSRRMFTWQSVGRARALKPDLLYTWFPQSAVFGLLHKIPTVFETHIQPTGLFGPMWHQAFAKLSGRKRLASITQALVDVLERDFHIHLDSDDIVIAPNGVDLERFASLCSRTCSPNPETSLIPNRDVHRSPLYRSWRGPIPRPRQIHPTRALCLGWRSSRGCRDMETTCSKGKYFQYHIHRFCPESRLATLPIRRGHFAHAL
jgi:hypothetical protein